MSVSSHGGNILRGDTDNTVIYVYFVYDLMFPVCDKSKFSGLESTQDASCWPAVFCPAATGYNGLRPQNYLIYSVKV